MASTTNIPVEEQVKRLTALPLPRVVRPANSIRALARILGIILLACLLYAAETISHHPHDFLAVVRNLVAFAIYVCTITYFYYNPRLRNLLRWGTPVAGRVLFAEKRRSATRIGYSYELVSGTLMEGEIMAYRRRDLVKGTPIVVFYDPKSPEYSSILGCKLWDIGLADSESSSP